MSRQFTQHFADPRGVLIKNQRGDALLAEGETVPSDAVAGYAPGCLFLKRGASQGAQVYVNEGSRTSADFNVFALGGLDLSTLTASAAELNILDGVLATTAELNRIADVSTRVVNVTSATLTLTELAHSHKLLVLDKADGIAITLPAAAAGLKFEFVVKTTFTAASSIKSVAGADVMIGFAELGNNTDNATVTWQALAASTYDTIDLFGTDNSTGGIAGQYIVIEGLAANLWHVRMWGDAAGTEATPFADTVA